MHCAIKRKTNYFCDVIFIPCNGRYSDVLMMRKFFAILIYRPWSNLIQNLAGF